MKKQKIPLDDQSAATIRERALTVQAEEMGVEQFLLFAFPLMSRSELEDLYRRKPEHAFFRQLAHWDPKTNTLREEASDWRTIAAQVITRP
jgi:hypothetical protein